MKDWQTTIPGLIAAIGLALAHAELPGWIRTLGVVLSVSGTAALGYFSRSAATSQAADAKLAKVEEKTVKVESKVDALQDSVESSNILAKPKACPMVISGEQCALPYGHLGGCKWANGD